MAKVIILGTGEVGSAALSYLVQVKEVKHIGVGDINQAQSENLLSQFPGQERRLTYEKVDAKNVESTAQVLAKYDYVLNCIGPYFIFAKPIFEAAMAAGITYIDVNDDWEPTLELLNLDKEAKSNKVAALVGMGASPGIANILAKVVMTEMPKAKKLITVWREDMEYTGYSAAKEHWLHQCSGDITIWQKGQLSSVKPLQAFEINFPNKGKTLLHYVGHPEPVTLPRTYQGLDFSVNAMSCPPGLIQTLKKVASAIDSNKLSVSEAAHKFNEFHDPHSDMTSPGLPGLFAQAIDANGDSVTAVLTQYPSALGPVTAAPMVAALRCLLNGVALECGVYTPEQILDPERFFNEFAEVINQPQPVWELYHG